MKIKLTEAQELCWRYAVSASRAAAEDAAAFEERAAAARGVADGSCPHAALMIARDHGLEVEGRGFEAVVEGDHIFLVFTTPKEPDGEGGGPEAPPAPAVEGAKPTPQKAGPATQAKKKATRKRSRRTSEKR